MNDFGFTVADMIVRSATATAAGHAAGSLGA